MWRNFLNMLSVLVVWSSVLPVQAVWADTDTPSSSANLLINGSFEEGVYAPDASPTGWRPEAFNASSALFTWDNQVAHSGRKSVKINLDVLNDARWVQTVTLQPNTNYEFSGWIKTQGVPFMHQTIDAGANLSTSAAFQLPRSHGLYGVNDWTYVSFNFNSAHWTELTFLARIGYSAGTALGTAWFDDLKLVPITRSIDPYNLLWNGSFEDGNFVGPLAVPYGWKQDLQGQAIIHWVDNEAFQGKRSVFIACPTYCSTSYEQMVAVQPNTDYLLSGWIKTQDVSHTNHLVDAGANLTAAGTWLYTPPLFGTHDWTYVSLLFNSGARTQVAVQARIGYDSGGARGNAWFDGLQLSPATANLVRNAEFALGSDPWLFYTNGQGSFTTAAPDSSSDVAARIEITQKGSTTQLYQMNLTLEPKTRYRLQFAAYSNSQRDLTVDLQQQSSQNSYGLRNYRPNLTAAWKTYTVEFTTKGFTAPVFDAQLSFIFNNLAKPGDVYWLDNIYLVKAQPKAKVAEAAAPTGGSVAGSVLGSALPVTVRVTDLDTAGAVYQAVTTTDSSGQFYFTELPAGLYELQVQPPVGYLTPDTVVFSASDGLADLEVLLEAVNNTIYLPQVAR